MSAIPRKGEAPSERKSGTLGDLLYAGRAMAPVPERDWVAIVEAMAARDQRALRDLYGRMHRIVFTLAMRITNDRATAEELTVDVFHELWRRAPEYDAAVGTVVSWVMNLTRSRAIDRLRFEQRKKRVGPRENEPSSSMQVDSAEEALVEADRSRQLRGAISHLTPGEREAIETAYFLELTHSEAAAHLSQPLGTVKTRIHSALIKLRLALGAGEVRS